MNESIRINLKSKKNDRKNVLEKQNDSEMICVVPMKRKVKMKGERHLAKRRSKGTAQMLYICREMADQ